MIPYVYYSHSDYSDVWPILFGETDKYLPNSKKILITNSGKAPSGWDTIYYDNNLPYQERVLAGLRQISDEIIIFSHEDMILYDHPHQTVINQYISLIEELKIDFIKLLRAGYTDEEIPSIHNKYLVKSPPSLIFSIQPTIAKKSSFITIYEETPGDSIWEFETNSQYTVYNHKFSGEMAYVYKDKKRGMYHWDSTIFPYIATAIVKGKWDTKTYPELDILLEKYQIDKSIRGVYDQL